MIPLTGTYTNAIYDEIQTSFTEVDAITLPSQGGGLHYYFTYNAADTAPSTGSYTTGFGELKSIVLPTGAEADYYYKLDDSTKFPLSNGTPVQSGDGCLAEAIRTRRPQILTGPVIPATQAVRQQWVGR